MRMCRSDVQMFEHVKCRAVTVTLFPLPVRFIGFCQRKTMVSVFWFLRHQKEAKIVGFIVCTSDKSIFSLLTEHSCAATDQSV